MYKRPPNLSFLKIWGCEVYVKRLLSDKLAPKSDKCLFVGYPKETRGYYFYNRLENRWFVARDGVFLEKEFVYRKTGGVKITLDEIRDEQQLDVAHTMSKTARQDESHVQEMMYSTREPPTVPL